MSNTPVHYETQHERWLKYGANVVLVSLLVIVLSVLLVVLAQKYNKRLDTTMAGLGNLKPQTLTVIQNNKSPIKIVCLYAPPEYDSETPVDERLDYRQPVIDLLEEYQSKGKNITIEIIDPKLQETKKDQLIDEVTNKYGGEIDKYKEIIKVYPGVYDEISKLATAEVAIVKGLPFDQVKEENLAETLNLAFISIQAFPKALQQTKEGINKQLKQKPPDYKGAVNQVQSGTSNLGDMLGAITDGFGKLKDDQKIPEVFRKYMAESLPRYQAIKKLADELADKTKKLGELKLDDLRQSLKARDSIIVMGEKEMKTIPVDKVWVVPEDARGFTSEGKPKPRFAGEQQITSAIVSLTAKTKPKVVFIRAGGGPLTMPGIRGFQRGGPFGMIASRLRDYNFEVLEKDITGMSAMRQQQFAPPEPSDEEIKDAIWIVPGFPSAPSQMGPPPSIAPRLKQHLDSGGSALVMGYPQGENFADALEPWGIKLRPDVVAAHEAVVGGPESTDIVEQAQREPLIFLLRSYGNHLITRTVEGLDGIFVPMNIVETSAKPGCTVTAVIPVPQSLKTWGETDVAGAMEGKAHYDAGTADKPGDLKPPLWAGAVSEKAGSGRVVVLGSATFAMDNMLGFPDQNLRKQGIVVSRFPANGELFMNSVFWLSKQDTMVTISASALEVNRVGEIRPGVLNFWRIGVLCIGLPLAVIAAGIWMFFNRQD